MGTPRRCMSECVCVPRHHSRTREHQPEARPASEPLPKSKEHHQSHPLRSLPTVSAPSRLSRRRGPRSSHWLLACSHVTSIIPPPPRLPQGWPGLLPPSEELPQRHSMCSSLFIMRAVASSLSWIHLCTAPPSPPRPRLARTCKFLVTPAPRSLRLSSPRDHLPAIFLPLGLLGCCFSVFLYTGARDWRARALEKENTLRTLQHTAREAALVVIK